MNFAALLSKATEVAGLFDNARNAFNTLKGNVAAGKAALSASELNQLEAQLNEIHAKNMALSAELDDTMSEIEKRG